MNSSEIALTWSPWLFQTTSSLGQAGEELVAVEDAQRRPAVLARGRGLHVAAEQQRAELHAVADAEDRDSQPQDFRIAARGLLRVNARRPAGEDQPFRRAAADFGGGDRERDDLRVHLQLAHAPRDELHVLRAEIQDQDGLVRTGGLHFTLTD